MVEREKISADNQQEHWLGVGMLLYPVKDFYPNLANMTRELSKANNSANPAAYKVLLYDQVCFGHEEPLSKN